MSIEPWGPLALYVGKGGRIRIEHSDDWDKHPAIVEIIRSDGSVEELKCSSNLTDVLSMNHDLVFHLPKYIVIDIGKHYRLSTARSSTHLNCPVEYVS